MLVRTTCASCGRELEMPYDAAIAGQNTHDTCPPPPKTTVDELFENFAALVTKIAAPDYRQRQHDELNLSALQERIDQFDQAPPRFGEAAVIYAQWGWPVFPLRPVGARCRNDRLDPKCVEICQCPKTPATPHGFKDATVDVDRIRAYWDRVPNANIGIATGHAFDVIDVDLPDGPASWQKMAGQPNAPDVHGIVSTASGGRHYLVTPTGIGNKTRIQPGMDYRGAGGYCVAPPSWLGSRAHQWKWITKPSPQIIGKVNA